MHMNIFVDVFQKISKIWICHASETVLSYIKQRMPVDVRYFSVPFLKRAKEMYIMYAKNQIREFLELLPPGK